MEDSDDDDNEDSVCVYSLNSEEGTDTGFEIVNTIRKSKNKGKSKAEVVEDSVDIEDSVYSQNSEEDTDTDTCSEFKMASTIARSKNKGKKKEEVSESSDEDSDSDYIEAFSHLDFEHNSNSDSSFSPDSKDTLSCTLTTTNVKPKVTKPKMKGKFKVIEDVDAISDSSCYVEPGKKMKKVKVKIKNPEAYLDNPENVYFETSIKNRLYELLVHSQLVKDYCLKFQDYICYIDPKGELEAKTAKWRINACASKMETYMPEEQLEEKKNRILCELLRKENLVYAIKIHIVREKDL